MFSAVRLPRGGFFKADILFGFFIITFLIMISCQPDKVSGDYIANCRTKVRNTLLKYCAGDSGLRKKRDTVEIEQLDNQDSEIHATNKRQISPEEASRIFDYAAPIISKFLHDRSRQFGSQSTPGPNTGRPNGAVGFPPPISGDDLGMTKLSEADLEDIYREMIERSPRAAKDKAETLKKITAYAARCCNEDRADSAGCSNPADVGDCP